MTIQRSTRLDWALFLLMGFFWGSSYLFIKIGVDNGLQIRWSSCASADGDQGGKSGPQAGSHGVELNATSHKR